MLPSVVDDDGDRISVTDVNGTVARFEMTYSPPAGERLKFGPPLRRPHPLGDLPGRRPGARRTRALRLRGGLVELGPVRLGRRGRPRSAAVGECAHGHRGHQRARDGAANPHAGGAGERRLGRGSLPPAVRHPARAPVGHGRRCSGWCSTGREWPSSSGTGASSACPRWPRVGSWSTSSCSTPTQKRIDVTVLDAATRR